MKTIIFFIICIFSLNLYAQEDIKSSGRKTYNISKKEVKSKTEVEIKKVSEKESGKKTYNISNTQKETKANVGISKEEGSGKDIYLITKKDETAPEIIIISPKLKENIPFTVNSMRLVVTGNVNDKSGILSVLVNNAEAIVTASGKFQAEVLLAYGINTIKIKAIDINKNISIKSYIVERKTGEIKNVIASTAAKAVSVKSNQIKIKWKMSGVSPYKTSFENYTIKACINSVEPIKEVSLYRNNKLITEISNRNVTFRGECQFNVNEQVKLIKGDNNFKLYVKTDKGFNESKVNVLFSIFNSTYYALIIGVEEYNDSRITDLSEPVEDATQLSKILSTSYAFENENIILLKNPTKSDIIGTLHNLRKKITENDNLLIFYAGHGYWDEEMQLGYWLPSDADKDNPVNWLPNTDLTNYLSAIKSKHTLLIADACFSGGIFKTRKAFNNTMAIEKLFQLKSRKAITSGTLTEVPDKSVFVEYLFKRLKDNTEKYITSEQLFSEMRMAVINNSPNIPQFGTIHNTGDEGGDFIFIKEK